jgi:CRP/FNR family transcriptional regulator, cyclic AMP receptor protein
MELAQKKAFLEEIKEEMICCFLDTEEIDKIASFFEIKKYPANTVIFKEGDAGDFIGFVVSGKLEVKKQTEFKGNQIIVALLSKGALVGELSMFDKHSRSATVEAVEDTILVVLTNEAMETLLRQYPAIGIQLLKGFIRILSLRLRKVTERLTTIF